MINAGHFFGDRRDLLHDRVGTLFCGAVGQLCGDDQITLVFIRQKGGWHPCQAPDRYEDQNKRKKHHDGAAARHCADQAHISPFGRTKNGVKAAIK